MTEKAKEAAKRLEEIIERLPREKQEYLLGVADGMDMMSEAQPEQKGA